MDLVSVIVPVYKVEQYLNKCVESIVNQSYTNLEIILVDDGSPDNCPRMCDEWARKDTRIKVIHKANGGLSDARNAGLKIATGEYIGFVDSDDWISSDMYELLYDQIVNDNADISACGVVCVFADGTQNTLTSTFCGSLNNFEAMRAIVAEDILKQPVWYKLYKRHLIDGLHFPLGKYHEDVFWSYKAISKAKKVSIINTVCYYYRQRLDSIMGSEFSFTHFHSIEAKIERTEYIQMHHPELIDLAKKSLWFSCIYAIQMSLLKLEKEKFDEAINLVNRAKRVCLPIKCRLSNKERMWMFMSRINFVGTCKLRNLFRIGF